METNEGLVTVYAIQITKRKRRKWYLKWQDLESDKWIQRVTDAKTKTDAKTLANQKSLELTKEAEAIRERRAIAQRNARNPSIDAFVERYKSEHLSTIDPCNRQKFLRCIDVLKQVAIEAGIQDLMLSDIRPSLLALFENELRSQLGPGSFNSYNKTLRAGFSWAASLELMPALPRRRQTTKEVPVVEESGGRAMTLEEIDRWVAKLPSVKGIRSAKEAKTYEVAMHIQRLTGMRSKEVFNFHTHLRSMVYPVDLDGEYPRLCYMPKQKNRRLQEIPLTPEAVTYIKSVMPPDGGWVCRASGLRGVLKVHKTQRVRINEAGKLAKIVSKKMPDGSIKYASTHDLRRTYTARMEEMIGGDRELLAEMVRHSDPSVTERYYLGSRGERLAKRLRDALAKQSL